jgi:long-chain fatty acid adenylyltransferase FadD28
VIEVRPAPVEVCIPAILRSRAYLQPDDTAFTFVDYERDRNGVVESLTWSQVYLRAVSVAQALRAYGSAGDRALIMAPHGLDYVAAFLGALQAGLVPVPLSVPLDGASIAGVEDVLRDTSPTVILTTSDVADSCIRYANWRHGETTPSVVQVDSLDQDWRKEVHVARESWPGTAYLQYTSGSTRQRTAVIVSHQNLLANYDQIVSDFFDEGGKVPPDTTVVSWLPFYHDMGLILGICAPILGGFRAVLMSPMSFLQAPARWLQLMAGHTRVWSAAPNFGYEMAVRRTSDRDMAGLDLRGVQGILNGGERIHPATLQRFTDRFAQFQLAETVIRPSYGLAEATVYVAARRPPGPTHAVTFDAEKLLAGYARRCGNGGGIALISYGVPRSPLVRIVDPRTHLECPAASTGEIWVHGANVAMGYWQQAEESERTFGATLSSPSAEAPAGPWLRTGDLGFFSDGELFVLGRLSDRLVVNGGEHSPDDIEATIRSITGGRAVAIAVGDTSADLIAIVELKDRESMRSLGAVKERVASAVTEAHNLTFSDVVLVAAGSIPSTTSGKVRRSACTEMYRRNEFTRLNSNDRQTGIEQNSDRASKLSLRAYLDLPKRLTNRIGVPVYPDDSRKDLRTVLSYLAGRSLSREEIWTAMELPRSTYYDQMDKGTLITADNLRTAAGNLGINRADLLTRYRLIDPEEVTALAEEIRGNFSSGPVSTDLAVTTAKTRTSISELRPRSDAPPL